MVLQRAGIARTSTESSICTFQPDHQVYFQTQRIQDDLMNPCRSQTTTRRDAHAYLMKFQMTVICLICEINLTLKIMEFLDDQRV